MRILFISSSPVRKDISSGNTFLNLFDGVEDVEFASIYTRAGAPDSSVSKAFCITEKMLIKNLFGKGCAGKEIETTKVADGRRTMPQDSKAVAFVKKHRWSIFFFVQELVWKIGRWKNKALKDFVDKLCPDVIFTSMEYTVFFEKLVLYIKKIANVPLVVYAWDNNYTMKRVMFSPLRWIYHICNRNTMRKVVENADLFYVISDVQKNEYEKAFGRECKVMTKGADFAGEPPVKTECNTPLQLLYTGNIGLSRWKSLAHIANVLERINQDGMKAQLRIYSGEKPDEKMLKVLNRGESSRFMGRVPAEEVAALQASADMLVHVEPMNIRGRLLVRQSFSTKLVDYFHQAKAIVAYGPKDVASIQHLIKNEAAIWADTEQALETQIREICMYPEKMQEYGLKAWICGKNNHQKNNLQEMLMRDIQGCIRK